jgi:hypothetical protein
MEQLDVPELAVIQGELWIEHADALEELLLPALTVAERLWIEHNTVLHHVDLSALATPISECMVVILSELGECLVDASIAPHCTWFEMFNLATHCTSSLTDPVKATFGP